MRKVRDAVIDSSSMQAITELQDSFGNRCIVQTKLLAPGADHAGDVATQEAVMSANEQKFISTLKAMGKTDEEIEALKK